MSTLGRKFYRSYRI